MNNVVSSLSLENRFDSNINIQIHTTIHNTTTDRLTSWTHIRRSRRHSHSDGSTGRQVFFLDGRAGRNLAPHLFLVIVRKEKFTASSDQVVCRACIVFVDERQTLLVETRKLRIFLLVVARGHLHGGHGERRTGNGGTGGSCHQFRVIRATHDQVVVI
jgi:hypothetical protein